MKFEEILPHLEKGKRVGNLLLDFGETQAKKSMEQLNNTIHDILYEDQEKSDSYHESFIKSVKDREKQKSIEINDLNQLDELISLEEAIHDYQQAREDYLKKVEEVTNFFKIDRQVFESILRIHFNASEVYVSEKEVKLIRYNDEEQKRLYEESGVFYDNIPEEAEEFLKTRKYIHKYIEVNEGVLKEEITFNIDNETGE